MVCSCIILTVVSSEACMKNVHMLCNAGSEDLHCPAEGAAGKCTLDEERDSDACLLLENKCRASGCEGGGGRRSGRRAQSNAQPFAFLGLFGARSIIFILPLCNHIIVSKRDCASQNSRTLAPCCPVIQSVNRTLMLRKKNEIPCIEERKKGMKIRSSHIEFACTQEKGLVRKYKTLEGRAAPVTADRLLFLLDLRF
jgi:hypothetical protein